MAGRRPGRHPLRHSAPARPDRRGRATRGRGVDDHVAGHGHRGRDAGARLRGAIRHTSGRRLSTRTAPRSRSCECGTSSSRSTASRSRTATRSSKQSSRTVRATPSSWSSSAMTERLTVEIEPELTTVEGEDEKKPRLGISLGIGYDFPFDVSIQVDPSIGGPSAGLMFSLAVYDTLTPGSLTDGEIIAGHRRAGRRRQGRPDRRHRAEDRRCRGCRRRPVLRARGQLRRRRGSRHRPDPGQGDDDAPGARGARGSGPTTATPSCRAAERGRNGLRAARSIPRWRPPYWRWRSTTPTPGGTSRRGSTRWSTLRSWSCTSRPWPPRSVSTSPASAAR